MESLIPPFDAYKGNAPYIFVSYAHKNSDVVFAHITRLRNEGFRIWYDEGIDPGADWSDEIASALANAAVFLVFISEAAVASHNVRKEIVFAIDQRKYMLCVHVEETELPSGLRMQLGNIQALLENRFHDKEKFYARLFSSLLPDETRGEERENLPIKEVPRKSKTAAKPSQAGKSKMVLWAALLVVLLGLAAFGFFGLTGGNGSTKIAFADKNLETALRGELQKPRGAFSVDDLASVKGRLNLVGGNITDIAPLGHMNAISLLNLKDNKIVDISPLGNLSEVVFLGLGNNQIRDLTPLKKLKNTLVGLSLAGNKNIDFTGLHALDKLEVLDIRGVPITDIAFAKYLRRLNTLILDDTGNGLAPQDVSRLRELLPPNCKINFDAEKP